jgi:hypothetical protein
MTTCPSQSKTLQNDIHIYKRLFKIIYIFMKLHSKIYNNNTLRNKSKSTLMDGSSFNQCPSTDNAKEAKKTLRNVVVILRYYFKHLGTTSTDEKRNGNKASFASLSKKPNPPNGEYLYSWTTLGIYTSHRLNNFVKRKA